MAAWTDIFFAKLQVLLGERTPKADAAVRWRDLPEVDLRTENVARTVFQQEAESLGGGTVDLTPITDAIAANVAATTAAQAELDDLTSGLVMALPGALASLEATQATLSAEITSVSDSVQGYQVVLNELSDGAAGAAVSVTAVSSAIVGQNFVIRIEEGATARQATPPNGFTVTIPQSRTNLLAGQRVKIGVLAKKPNTGGATRFGVTYTGAEGTSGYMVAPMDSTTTWQWFTFFYDMPALAIGGDGYLSIFGDNTKSGLATFAAQVYIEVAAVAGELPEINSLQASITDIRALDISALAGTAFATFLTQLGVAAGGLSSFVTTTGSAVATLANHAAAMYSLRVGAGGASAGFEIVASDDPISGAASTIKLSAKHVEILASSMRISDSANVFPDFDMMDPLFYSTANGAAFDFVTLADPALGRYSLRIQADAAAKSVESGWFLVEPSTEYLVSGAAWVGTVGAGMGTVTLTIETGSMDSAGAVTVLTSNVVQTQTDLQFSGAVPQISLSTGATVRRARFKLTRAAGGAGGVRTSGLKVQKKAGANLIVDGAVVAQLLAAGEVITDSMIVNGAVGRRAFQAMPGFNLEELLTGIGTPPNSGVVFGSIFTFDRQPYVFSGPTPLNPVVLELFFTVNAHFNFNVGSGVIQITVQKRIPPETAWSLSAGFEYPIVEGNTKIISTRFIDGYSSPTLQFNDSDTVEYRILIGRAGVATPFYSVTDASIVMSQISK